MAQMYEAFLYGFWAPFANQYAEALSSPSRTLDNVLQHLYIEGKSDAGKDKLTEYILRLVSDNTVISGVDADDVGVKGPRRPRMGHVLPVRHHRRRKKKIQRWGRSETTGATGHPPASISRASSSRPTTRSRNPSSGTE